ncbi:MAG: radical SAM protein [Patescibacteria group bacterium]
MDKFIESLCEHCKGKIKAEVIVDNNKVYYKKKCHNTALCSRYKPDITLISSNATYFFECLKIARKRKLPITNMCIIELTDDCNIKCSTCIASSFPGAGKYKTIDEIKKMVAVVEDNDNHPETIMISGGEPTIHPQFMEIIELVFNSKIQHIILITNGIKIAEDERFVSSLSEFKNKLEIYLQFDSLNPSPLIDIRGTDFSKIRKQSLSNLEKYNIPTTLVCVVKKGINDKEINKIIKYALGYNCVKGVTLQPIKATGRHQDFDKELNTISLSEVRQLIIDEKLYFDSSTLIPHPVNPVNISIGYLLKSGKNITTVTKELFSKQNKVFPYSQKLRKLMFFLPSLNSNKYNYENLFRLAIVSYMDVYNFNYELLLHSNISFVADSLEIIPLDTYYLFNNKGNRRE